ADPQPSGRLVRAREPGGQAARAAGHLGLAPAPIRADGDGETIGDDDQPAHHRPRWGRVALPATSYQTSQRFAGGLTMRSPSRQEYALAKGAKFRMGTFTRSPGGECGLVAVRMRIASGRSLLHQAWA